ncbi:MAG: 3-oxo-4,17-pregnadiene-20-carboxyl-CoA hydratase beta subunit [Frankiales bacterium]|nr:igrE [Frankiales bacterium]MCW2708861.1 igrE [Frankiales bacterium]MDX6219661.1 3-oxo-4,17-pregnadiene-20-carboxyl-CoA hydratase beta subunit [Frankiales bacterium]
MTTTSVAVGTELPELVLEASVRNIVATAIASRDYQDVHHDVATAQVKGSKTIFTNILTSNGYVLRYVTDFFGPLSVVKTSKLRLGVPNYAGEVMTMRGTVKAVEGNLVTVDVKGSNSLGDHVIATVTLEVPK